jgi:uncharacterized membrane protein YkvA (DUF1232 family)
MANEGKQKTSVLQFFDNMRLLILMFIDSWRGTYRQLPWWCTVVLVFTLLYALSPVDLIPDVIPVIGVLDDVTLLYMCYKVIETEIGKYRDWRSGEAEIIDVKAE